MPTTIMGHTLTAAQLRVLDEVTDYLKQHSGDTGWQPSFSPMGNGRWVPLLEIIPRGAGGGSRRAIVYKLNEWGVLRACEIAFYRGCLKPVPMEQMDAELEAVAETSP